MHQHEWVQSFSYQPTGHTHLFESPKAAFKVFDSVLISIDSMIQFIDSPLS